MLHAKPLLSLSASENGHQADQDSSFHGVQAELDGKPTNAAVKSCMNGFVSSPEDRFPEATGCLLEQELLTITLNRAARMLDQSLSQSMRRI